MPDLNSCIDRAAEDDRGLHTWECRRTEGPTTKL